MIKRNFNITDDQLLILQKLATLTKESQSYYVRRALQQYFQSEEMNNILASFHDIGGFHQWIGSKK